jgi:hypothetical protein
MSRHLSIQLQIVPPLACTVTGELLLSTGASPGSSRCHLGHASILTVQSETRRAVDQDDSQHTKLERTCNISRYYGLRESWTLSV